MWTAEDAHLESVYEDREAYGLDDQFGDYGDDASWYGDEPDGDDIEDEDQGEPFDPAEYEVTTPSYWDRALAGGLVVAFTL